MRDYELYYTEDGSVGLYSYKDKDVYHSKFGAQTEAWEKFIVPIANDETLNDYTNIKVLDICYGIGYNTKSFMSFIINKHKKLFKKKNFLEKFLEKRKSKNSKNIETINTNKLQKKDKMLSSSIETISDDNNIVNKENNSSYDNNISLNDLHYQIDCLDINEELVKLSPLFKTLKTPYEIFSYFVPDILDCFDTYYKIRDVFANFISKFMPRNRKEINELLDLRFKIMYMDKEYKVNPLVNYFIENRLTEIYKKENFAENIKEIVTERKNRRYFDKDFIKYTKFNQKWGYKTSSNSFLSTFLHNIYYSHLSRRYKKIDFKAIEKAFKLNFYIQDARKTILELNEVYDYIFLDAFTYAKAPQLWSLEFISELYNKLSNSGLLMTYSNSALVRNTLLQCGFYVGKIYNKKSNTFIGTIASKDKNKIEYPLSNYELGLCNTKAGIPYHDPGLNSEAIDILAYREYEFKHSNLMPSSKYMRLRSMRDNDEE